MLKRTQVSAGIFVLLAGIVLCPIAQAADRRLLIPGRVNGRSATFALDTGTSFALALPERNLAKFGLQVDKALDSAIVRGFSNPVAINLPPNFTAHNVSFAIVVDGPPTFDWGFDVLIGWEGMRRMPLLYRANGRQVVIGHPPKARDGAAAYQLIPSNVVLFDGDPGAQSLPVLIDTGWSGGVRLAPELWTQWRAKSRAPNTVMTEFSPNHGLVVVDQIFAAEFEIGGLKLRNVMVSEMPASHVRGVTEKVVLGLEAFANHELMIDGPAGKVMIGKADATVLRPDYNRLGATFVPNTMAARVAPDSPAAIAGIRDGDILIAIDGMTPKDYASRRPERSVWEQPAGTRVTLTLERAGSRITSQVTLSDFIER